MFPGTVVGNHCRRGTKKKQKETRQKFVSIFKFIWYLTNMLTLESRCIPVMLGGVLILRTLPNRAVKNKRLQSSGVFIGTIATDTIVDYQV